MDGNSESEATSSSETSGERARFLTRAADYCRSNPYAVIVLGAATLAGAVGALFLPFEDLSTTRRIVGGAIAGFYFGLFPLGFRLFN